MKAKELASLLNQQSDETTALISLHGKLYEVAPSGVQNDDGDTVRVDLIPVNPPALRKYEEASE